MTVNSVEPAIKGYTSNGDLANGTESGLDRFYSSLQRSRLDYVPPKPAVLQGRYEVVRSPTAALQTAASPEEVQEINSHFPLLSKQAETVLLQRMTSRPHDATPAALKVGVVLSGGQAPGGHNVIGGLLDCLVQRHPGSKLFGFLNGPKGILLQQYKQITVEDMLSFRNQGGFHLIGAGRDKIETDDDLELAAKSVSQLDLDGLVIIGGDDSNTNAAVLAEYFLSKGLKTGVIGVPKTIDGDLKNEQVAISFGFDTACKVFSESIGNIQIDSLSAKKYYHFIRLMGRAASHITLECALQTHPQAALICEEVEHCNLGLSDIVSQLSDIVAARAQRGMNYGVVLIPEGLIEHIPEMNVLIRQLNEILANEQHNVTDVQAIASQLEGKSRQVFEKLPLSIRLELLLERDPHGNVQVARIETEKLLQKMLEDELAERKAQGTFRGKFACVPHYFGYEGRCSLPTNFDATYCAALGYAAGALVALGQSGLMATVGNFERPTVDWSVGGTPLISMMCMERRRGKNKPVIRKAMVDLQGAPFLTYKENRDYWALNDCFRAPGPIQFTGPASGLATLTLSLERNGGRSIALH
eukprot:jgi/Botrbrau1/21255/Bobra.39_2s0048.1